MNEGIAVIRKSELRRKGQIFICRWFGIKGFTTKGAASVQR